MSDIFLAIVFIINYISDVFKVYNAYLTNDGVNYVGQ
jgi:hypothetical protein